MINIAGKPQRIQQASPMQWAAMNITDHDILVSAAAGSGKTKVLAERIASKIFDNYIDPEKPNLSITQFLVVTFTEASAREMKIRIEKQLRHHFKIEHFSDEAAQIAGQLYLKQQLIDLAQAPISTLHAFCLSIIKDHYYQVEEYYHGQIHSLSPNYQVANDEQLREVKLVAITDTSRKLETLPGFYEVYRLLSGDRDDNQFNETIFNLYNQMMSTPHPLKWVNEQLSYYYLAENQHAYYQDIILGMMVPQIEQYLDYVYQLLQTHLHAAKTSPYLDVSNNKDEHLQSVIIQNIEANIKAIEDCRFQLYRCLEMSDLASFSEVFDNVQQTLIKFKQWTVKKDASRKEELLEVKQAYNNAIDDFLQTIDNIGQLPADIKWYCEANIHNAWQDQQSLLPLVQALKEVLVAFHDSFIAEKRRRHFIDYHDFEQLALNLLAQHDEYGQIIYDAQGAMQPSDLAKAYQQQFVEIYVDEYQDTNEVQESILNLVRHHTQATFFRVGDLKQSIYKFRQANPKLFIDKSHTYYPLELPKDYDDQQDVRITKVKNQQLENSLLIHLSENYRSHYTVLESINYLFNHLMDKNIGELAYDKDAALYYPTVKPQVAPFSDTTVQDYAELVLLNTDTDSEEEDLSKEEQQAEYVAQEIKNLVDNNDEINYGDFTILQRSVVTAPIYQRIFAKYDIPFYSPLKAGFMATDEVQIMLSCLRVIDNQNQDIPLVALLRSPLFAITDAQLAYIRILSPKGEFSVHARKVAYRLSELTLPETLNVQDIEHLSQQLRQVFDSIALWREYAQNHALSDLVQYIYQQYYYPQRVLGLSNGQQRQLHLMQFKDFVAEFENNYIGADLTQFINYVDVLLDQQQDKQPPNIAKNNVVSMMTIHGSKGLEFKYVYLVGTDKNFNDTDLKRDYLANKQEGVALKYYDTVNNTKRKTFFLQSLIYKERKEMLSEELRLLYVALTRAEYKFTVIASKKLTYDEANHINLPRTLVQDARVHAYQRYKAQNYIDFILPVIRMHPSAWQEGMIYQETTWPLNELTEYRAHWKVVIPSNVQETEQQVWVDNMHVPQMTFGQQVQQVLETLPHVEQTHPPMIHSQHSDLPSKFGVSRLKKLHQEFTEGQQPRYLKYKQLDFTSDDDISEEISMSATDRGTLIHRIIELLINDKKIITHQDQLLQFIHEQIASGKIDQTFGEAFLSQNKGIETLYEFTQSTIYQRILDSQMVKTEYDFVSRVPLVNLADMSSSTNILQISETQGVYTGLNIPEHAENLLVQGIIDCLIQVDAQHYVIIDFKSDKVAGRSEQELVEIYRPQLALYKQAIYQMLVQYQSEVQVDAVLHYLNANESFEV